MRERRTGTGGKCWREEQEQEENTGDKNMNRRKMLEREYEKKIAGEENRNRRKMLERRTGTRGKCWRGNKKRKNAGEKNKNRRKMPERRNRNSRVFL
ncbi:hypothetical protein ACLOJK_016286 [Asimina triloba]